MRLLANIGTFLIVIVLAEVVERYGSMDATTFVAGAALWHGIRAWSKAEDVSATHTISKGS